MVMKQKQKTGTMLIQRIILHQKMEINQLILKRKKRKPKNLSLIRKRKMKSQQVEVVYII